MRSFRQVESIFAVLESVVANSGKVIRRRWKRNRGVGLLIGLLLMSAWIIGTAMMTIQMRPQKI